MYACMYVCMYPKRLAPVLGQVLARRGFMRFLYVEASLLERSVSGFRWGVAGFRGVGPGALDVGG